LATASFLALSLTYPYKAFPCKPDPVSKLNFVRRPALNVIIFGNRRRTTPIECIVDTGADRCFFHGQIGEALGLDVRTGIQFAFIGVAGSENTGYIHKVRLQVAGESYETTAVFTYALSIPGGLLGQLGFFDHFIATFDWTPNPPQFSLQRIPRN
jgi:Aspartyl protease